MKDDRDWIPDATDLDWIESNSVPPPAAVLAIEAAAEPLGVPIVDRHSGRVLVGARGGSAPDRRGRDRLRPLDVVDGPGPAGRRHDRDDRPRPRTDGPRPRLVARRRDRRGPDHGRHGQGARGLRRRGTGARGTVRHGLHRRPETRIRGVPRRPRGRGPLGAGRARRRRQRALERPRLGVAPGGSRTTRARTRSAGSPSGSSATTGSPPRSCRSGTDCSSPRGTASSMRIRVRLFAVQRELAGTREVGLDVPPDATIADAWDALVTEYPALRPGRDFVRFARNGAYADATTALQDGDEVAMIPPVSGGGGTGADAHPGASRRPVRRHHPRRADGAPGIPGGRGGRGVPRADPGHARYSGTRPGGGGRPPRRPRGGVAGVRGPRIDGAGGPRRDRR